MTSRPILIFDFDGTIADTHQYIVDVSNRLALEFNYNQISDEDSVLLKDFSVQEVIRHLEVPLLKIPAIIARAKKEFYQDIQSIHPIKGLQEALDALKARGVVIGILSSNAAENIHAFLQRHGIDHFDFIHSTSKIWGKDISIKGLIAEHHLNRDDVIYIGDEIRDIAAARKAGVRVAAVTWGYNSAQALQKEGPDALLHFPHELVSFCHSLQAPLR